VAWVLIVTVTIVVLVLVTHCLAVSQITAIDRSRAYHGVVGEFTSPDSGGSFERMPVMNFDTKRLPVKRDAVAPDGSDVRILLRLAGGSTAHFEIPPGETSTAVTHKTIGEIWFFLSGRGEMWRRQGEREETVPVERGVCLTIPVGTQFQFRSFGDEPLTAHGVTMPPWPGEGEATIVEGPWKPTLPHPD
jgi:mannose-6-phosphate isomerase-like protein (cupin superfamily)